MASIVHLFFVIYQLMLVVRVLSSWIPEIQHSRFILFVSLYTDPYLNFFRGIVPPFGLLDLSPLVAFFALQLGESFLVYWLPR